MDGPGDGHSRIAQNAPEFRVPPAAGRRLRRRYRNAKPRSADGSSRVYEAAGRTIQVTAGEIDGRPIVLYVDVPIGASTDVIDLSKVALRE